VYGWPTLPVVTGEEVMAGGVAVIGTVIVKLCSAVPSVFEAVTVTWKLPGEDGVHSIKPVEVLITIPGGKAVKA
jgi:hypothetical protein